MGAFILPLLQRNVNDSIDLEDVKIRQTVPLPKRGEVAAKNRQSLHCQLFKRTPVGQFRYFFTLCNELDELHEGEELRRELNRI